MRFGKKELITLCCSTGMTLLVVGGLVRMYVIHRPSQDFFSQSDDFDEAAQPWEECAFTVPGRAERVVFLRRPAHPFLAEYRRAIRLDRPNEDPVTCPLPINCGGRTMINVSLVKARGGFGPLILMQDHWGEYLLDLSESRTLQLVRVGEDRLFAGRLTDDTGGGYLVAETDGQISVSVGAEQAREVTQFEIRDRREYLGRLDGRSGPLRFVPVSAAAEEPIRFVWDDEAP